MINAERCAEAFGNIAFYNGHAEWLLELASQLDGVSHFPCPVEPDEWYTDKHCLWMFLVGMFGDWGTSIRCGWIDDCEEAAAFIRMCVTEEDTE